MILIREKRKNHRYDCIGQASIVAAPDQPAIRGRILNLSARGCMIEFFSPPQIESNQSVELIFCVNGLPFHVSAHFKGERGKTKYGFQFPQLLERVRIQLEELLRELPF